MALAVSIAVILAIKLDDVSVQVDGLSASIHTQCYLGTAVESTSLCTYVYVVVGVSVGVSLALSLVQCVTCNLCGLGGVLDAIFAILGLVWWVIAGAIVTARVQDASSVGLTMQGWRTRIVILMWIEAGLFLLLTLLAIIKCFIK